MKIRFLLGLCASLFLAGCATTTTANWDQRVGSLTYEQAVAELGEPMGDMKKTDGTREVTWLVERGSPQTVGSSGMGGDPAYHASGTPPLRSEFPSRPERYLHLYFGSDGLLKSWGDVPRPVR